jgi:hypothetical protein
METSLRPAARLPRPVTLVLLVAAAILLLVQMRGLALQIGIPGGDFPNYWTPGRANAVGSNPYDPAALLAIQHMSGWPYYVPVTSWYPPWVLAVFMPLGLLPYGLSRALWLLLSLGLLVGSVVWLWGLYGGATSRRWLALMALLIFAPAIFALAEGQISPLVLAGIVGFLYFCKRKQWVAAGACVVLVALKPQIAYVFLAAIGLWVLRERQWQVLLGMLLAGLLAMGVTISANPAVTAQYLARLGHYPAEYANSATIGALLRLIFGHEHFALQFIAPTLGLAWLTVHWWRARAAWRWQDQMALLLLVGIITAPVAWMHDEVVLLPAVVQALAVLSVARRPRQPFLPLAVYAVANLIALAVLPALRFDQVSYMWLPFALLVFYRLSTKPVTVCLAKASH